VRGDGSIDEDEVAFLHGLGDWMSVNGEAIFGTRPWKVYGEGPSVTEKAEGGTFGGARDVRRAPYTALGKISLGSHELYSLGRCGEPIDPQVPTPK
jgi:hypothetical protein